MKKIFFLLAAASVMFAACNPEEQKEELKKATGSVEAGDEIAGFVRALAPPAHLKS